MVQFTEDTSVEKEECSTAPTLPRGMSMASEAAQKLRKDLAKSRPFATGTLIAWRSISSTGISYEYAAIYANGSWYTTIQNDNQHVQRVMSHRKLMDYFSSRGDHLADLRVATDFEAVSL